jgi:hypothetical protein
MRCSTIASFTLLIICRPLRGLRHFYRGSVSWGLRPRLYAVACSAGFDDSPFTIHHLRFTIYDSPVTIYYFAAHSLRLTTPRVEWL